MIGDVNLFLSPDELSESAGKRRGELEIMIAEPEYRRCVGFFAHDTRTHWDISSGLYADVAWHTKRSACSSITLPTSWTWQEATSFARSVHPINRPSRFSRNWVFTRQNIRKSLMNGR